MAGNPGHRDILNEMRDLTDKRVKELGGPLSPMKGALHLSLFHTPSQLPKLQIGRGQMALLILLLLATAFVIGLEIQILVQERRRLIGNRWYLEDEDLDLENSNCS